MKEQTKTYLKAIVNIIIGLIVAALVIFVLPKAISFFMPFVVAWIIALIASPLVKFLEEKLRIKRKAGTAAVIIIVILLIVLAGYGIGLFLAEQIRGLIAAAPYIWETASAELDAVGAGLSSIFSGMPQNVQDNWKNLLATAEEYLGSRMTDPAGLSMEWVGAFAKQIPNVFVGIIMGALSSYFFIAERTKIHDWFQDKMPEGIKKYWNMIKDSLAVSIGGFAKSQVKIECWIYIILVIGLFILGYSFAPIVSLIIAVVDIVPVFGSGTVLCPWAVLEIAGGNYQRAIGLFIIWIVASVARQFIQPKIMGDSMGVPPIPTLFLLFIGFRIKGILGMLLALPVGIILYNMYQRGVFDTFINSWKIIIKGVNTFRKLTPNDKKMIYNREEESKEERKEEN